DGGAEPLSESESESESEELSVEEVEREVEVWEERDASRVDELVWDSEEVRERAFRLGRRRRFVDVRLEDVDEVSDEELWGGVDRFLQKASAARRPTAVEMKVSMVGICSRSRHLWRRGYEDAGWHCSLTASERSPSTNYLH
ncbi:MAG: hypothetical protein Q9211_006985, partial [Gyalolechia sp. 1 TL-2023]